MSKFINEREVYEMWAPMIERTADIKDRRRLTWMAQLLENQRIYEDARNIVHVNPDMNVPGMGAVRFPGDPSYTYNFRNQVPGSGDKPISLLPIAMQVAAQTIGLDLVPVIPMSGPMGMLTYMDFVYAGGKLDSRESPLMIKVPLSLTSGVSLTQGTTYYVRNAGTNYYMFTYIGKSRIDGYPIFRTIPTETNGTSKGIGAVGNATINYVVDNCTLYNAASAGTVVAAFDGIAELVKALEDHVPGFSSRAMRLGDGVTNATEGYLREEGESEPGNLMGLTLRNLSVTAQTHKVDAGVTREQIDDLRLYNIDAIGQLEASLSNELTQNINRMILDKMFAMGATSSTRWFMNQGENFNLNFNTTDRVMYIGNGVDGNPVPAMATKGIASMLGGENVGTMQRRILTSILGASNAINNHTRRGNANFCVTNYQIGTALQSIAGFQDYPLTNTISQTGSIYNLGSIAGVNVYVDPNMNWSDTRIVVGRRGDSNSTGLVFMPYLMAQQTSIIAESTMAPRISLQSRFALVEAGHHPEDTYLTLKVEAGNVMSTILG